MPTRRASPMTTQCIPTELTFPLQTPREVRASFDGGTITSDGGALLLGQVEAKTAILEQFAACFTDHRDPDLIEHPVADLLAQRVYGLALGYEDLNDHDTLRRDPLLATVIGKADPTGTDRVRPADRGKPLAGKSTLNRLELTRPEATGAERYKKIVANTEAIDCFLVQVFLQAHAQPPARSCWTWMPPTIHYTGIRKAASFTATTRSSATCRCISSAASICCVPACAPLTTMPPGVPKKNWSASSPRSEPLGRTSASSCGPTRASAASG